jgi:hypothetical protein
VIGPYGLAFFFALMANQAYSETSLVHPAEVFSYIVDAGFPHVHQLFSIHSAIIRIRKTKGKCCLVGSLTQDTDERVPALQAADVVAWSARRRELKTLTDEFAPLNELISTRKYRGGTGHTHIPFPKGGIKMFADPVNKWIDSGVMPSLDDIMR